MPNDEEVKESTNVISYQSEHSQLGGLWLHSLLPKPVMETQKRHSPKSQHMIGPYSSVFCGINANRLMQGADVAGRGTTVRVPNDKIKTRLPESTACGGQGEGAIGVNFRLHDDDSISVRQGEYHFDTVTGILRHLAKRVASGIQDIAAPF